MIPNEKNKPSSIQQSPGSPISKPTKAITAECTKSPESKFFVTQDAKIMNPLLNLPKGKEIIDSHQKLNSLVEVSFYIEIGAEYV